MTSKRNGAILGRLFIGLALLSLATGCAGQLPQVIPSVENATPQEPASGPQAPANPTAPEAGLLALPAAFRYQVVLRPAGQPDAPPTLISGQYRDGAWQQTSRTNAPGVDPVDEELIVARDPEGGALRSYTRAITDTLWTRWPGVTFDASYGLASPFTALRLRRLATQTAAPEAAAADGPIGTTKMQALFSAEDVRRLLLAGVASVATDADTREAMDRQLSALFVPQTLTFWTDAEGRVAQAAGTLLALGPDNQPAPWLEMTAAYSGYDDPAIIVAPPVEASDIGDVAESAPPEERTAGAPEVDPAAGITLRVRVFATAGVPASDAIVTVYAAGKKTLVDEKLGPDAQFALKPGRYDVLARSGGAQEWLKDVAVTEGSLASNDVLFDFAPLIVATLLGGAAPPVDVVVYPAGERVRFASFATGNPARFQLPAGLYDVEVATIDGSARKRVEGVSVRGGLETTLTIDLAAP